MATSAKHSYSSANATVRREQYAESAAGNAAESCKFRTFQKARLKAAHVVVMVAGTSVGHLVTLKHGTTSIGAVTLSTSAAGVSTSITDLNRDLAALDQISLTNGTDATGRVQVVYEYEVMHDAVQTV